MRGRKGDGGGLPLVRELQLRARTSRKHERHARGERLPLVELRDERKNWEGDVMPREVSRKGRVFCRTMGHMLIGGGGRHKNRIRRLNTIIFHMILVGSCGGRKYTYKVNKPKIWRNVPYFILLYINN